MTDKTPECAKCPFEINVRFCTAEDGKAPESCPTTTKKDLIAKALDEFKKPEINLFARQASVQEAEGYYDKELGHGHVKPLKPRILETVEFAKKMNYRRLGFVFCVGLRKEAKVVGNFFESKGFEVISCCCKAGKVPKEFLGLSDDQKIQSGRFESMCNPVLQALVLNEEKTQFNIVMGLCVGHDSLFLKYAEAPCTVLVAKDRLLGHNPLAAVYTMDSYYRALKQD